MTMRFLAVMTSLLLAAPLTHAQTPPAPTPATSTPTGQVGGIPVTAVQQQNGQQFLMPISLDLLPYGTVTLSEGRYLISNYEGRGIDIYIYSPQPLRIATYAEMMLFQSQFGQMMKAVAQGSPVPMYTTQNPPLAVSTPTPAAPLATPPALPSPPPATAAAASPPAAPTATPSPLLASSLPSAGPTRSSTSLPPFLTGFFNGSMTTDALVINYSLTNRSANLTARIDPTNLLIQQGDSYLPARLSARDSSGEASIVPPRSAQIGTITIPTTTPTPVTIQWTVQNVRTGELYPMTYTYVPPVQASR